MRLDRKALADFPEDERSLVHALARRLRWVEGKSNGFDVVETKALRWVLSDVLGVASEPEVYTVRSGQ